MQLLPLDIRRVRADRVGTDLQMQSAKVSKGSEPTDV